MLLKRRHYTPEPNKNWGNLNKDHGGSPKVVLDLKKECWSVNVITNIYEVNTSKYQDLKFWNTARTYEDFV